jgi:hypothetical protein
MPGPIPGPMPDPIPGLMQGAVFAPCPQGPMPLPAGCAWAGTNVSPRDSAATIAESVLRVAFMLISIELLHQVVTVSITSPPGNPSMSERGLLVSQRIARPH